MLHYSASNPSASFMLNPGQRIHGVPVPHEGIDVLAAMAPVHGPRWAAHAGHTHVQLDGN
jgi:hypothetical protein